MTWHTTLNTQLAIMIIAEISRMAALLLIPCWQRSFNVSTWYFSAKVSNWWQLVLPFSVPVYMKYRNSSKTEISVPSIWIRQRWPPLVGGSGPSIAKKTGLRDTSTARWASMTTWSNIRSTSVCCRLMNADQRSLFMFLSHGWKEKRGTADSIESWMVTEHGACVRVTTDWYISTTIGGPSLKRSMWMARWAFILSPIKARMSRMLKPICWWW